MSDDFEIAAVAPINPKWLDDEPGIDWPGHPSDTNALGNLRPTPLSEALAGRMPGLDLEGDEWEAWLEASRVAREGY